MLSGNESQLIVIKSANISEISYKDKDGRPVHRPHSLKYDLAICYKIIPPRYFSMKITTSDGEKIKRISHDVRKQETSECKYYYQYVGYLRGSIADGDKMRIHITMKDRRSDIVFDELVDIEKTSSIQTVG